MPDDRELLDIHVRALFRHDARGRGYATDVTTGWARLVRSEGAAPLYSTAWENAVSQSVAKRLRLVQYASDFQVT